MLKCQQPFISMLNTVNPVLSGHLKIDKTNTVTSNFKLADVLCLCLRQLHLISKQKQVGTILVP